MGRAYKFKISTSYPPNVLGQSYTRSQFLIEVKRVILLMTQIISSNTDFNFFFFGEGRQGARGDSLENIHHQNFF